MSVQVRLLTNMSDPFPKKIVRERLDPAFYGERLRDIVYFVMVGYLVVGWDGVQYCDGKIFPMDVHPTKLNRPPSPRPRLRRQ